MMKKILFTFFIITMTIVAPRLSFAATVLSPGDLVIITANGTGTYPSTNGFDFVSRVDIDAGTVIYFTDKGWDGSLGVPFWRNTAAEGVVRYTAPSAITAGTIVHFDDSLIAAAPGTWDMFSIDGATGAFGVASGANVMDFATGGDNILVFQGTGAAPSFLYGVGWALGTTWISSGTPTSNNSWAPSPLSAGSGTIVSLGTGANKQYQCTITGMYASNFLTSLTTSGNWNSGATIYGTSPCIFDATQPVATITQGSGQNDPTNNDTITFRITFDSAINAASFITTDITLSGTASSSINSLTQISSTQWDVVVKATTDGTVTINLPAGTVLENSSGNPNKTSVITDNTVTYDTTAPSAPTLDLVAGSDTGISSTDNITSDDTPTFDLTCETGAMVTLFDGASTIGSGNCIAGTVTITATILVDGTHTITASQTDVAGNISPLSTPVLVVVTDTVGITATINQAVGQTDPATTGPIHFTLVFSESIVPSTLVVGDFTVVNGTVTSTTTSDNITWDVAVTPSSDGSVTITLPAGTVTDTAGNTNTNSTSTDNTVTYDTTAPILSEITAVTNPTNDATPNYTFATNEAGTIAYGGSCSSATTAAGVGNNTITLNSLSDGTYGSCTITVTDVAGNISSALTLSSFTIDTTAPTIILSTAAPAVVTGLFTVTITPSESVSEFTLSDISVTNGTASNLTGSGIGPYTVDITPTSNGSLTVSIPSGVSPVGVVDTVGNRQGINSNTISKTVTFPTPVTPVTGNTSGGGIQYCTHTITTFCTPRSTQTIITPAPVSQATSLGKPGQCSVDVLLTQNMRAGARNGHVNNYSRSTIAHKEIMREVVILQKHMNRLGFSSGVEDGILGSITDGAIKRMQKFLGTQQDGKVGPVTRSLINNSCGH